METIKRLFIEYLQSRDECCRLYDTTSVRHYRLQAYRSAIELVQSLPADDAFLETITAKLLDGHPRLNSVEAAVLQSIGSAAMRWMHHAATQSKGGKLPKRSSDALQRVADGHAFI